MHQSFIQRCLLGTLLLIAISPALAHDFEVDGIYYNYVTDANGTEVAVTFKGYDYSFYNEYSEDIVIPSSVSYNGKEYSVARISDYAFTECSGMTSVIIPNSVKTIGYSAFRDCIGLTSVAISNSVKTITYSAFQNCIGLTSVAIPDSVTTIGNSAFKGCIQLTSVIIPDSVKKISNSAFQGCRGLTSVTIPNSVTTIGEKAFEGCSGLSNIIVSEGNSKYDSREYCNAIVETRSNTLIVGCQNTIIPSSVTTIGNSAFKDCIGLTSITLPNSVTTIGNDAFRGCSGLISISMSNSIKTIGGSAFGYCSGLTSVTLPNSVTTIGSDAFRGCSGLKKSAYPNHLSNPFSSGISISYSTDGVIDSSGIIYNKDFSILYFVPLDVDSVTIPNSVRTIGNCAFKYCIRLTTISLSNSVTTIGNDAFMSCSGLTTVTLPNSVTTIGNDAFRGCSGLKKSAYPNHLSNPFSSGISISYSTDGVIDSSGIIYNKDFSTLYFVPLDVDSVTIPNSVSTIGNCAFLYCCKLTSITIPKAVTFIGEEAFANCNSIQTINYHAANCTLSERSFLGCDQISSVVIENGVQSIPNHFASRLNYQFNTISLPNSLETIGDYSFYNCKDLISVTIPNSVTTVGNQAFSGCVALSSVTFGSGLLSIGTNAFPEANYNLDKAFWLCNTPPNGIENIKARVNYVANNKYSFNNQKYYPFLSSKFVVDNVVYVPVSPSDRTCDLVDYVYNDTITSLSISEKVSNRGVELSVVNIGEYAFARAKHLSKIELHNKISFIPKGSFIGCSSLTEIQIPDSASYIGGNAFDGCKSLSALSIPAKVATIGDYAFVNSTSLSDITIENSKDVLTLGSNGNKPLFSDACLRKVKIARKLSYKQDADHGYSPFYSNKYLQEIEVIDNETQIYEKAFYGCNNLRTATLSNSVTHVGDMAFYGCSKMDSISFGKNVTHIGASAFHSCSSLSEIIIPELVSCIRDNTFNGCWSLSALSIPAKVKSIGDYAFANCTSLSDITIKDSKEVLTLGSNGNKPLFSDTPLDEVYIGRKISYKTSANYGYSPFYRNTSIRMVEITDYETEIYHNEFYGCTGLNSLKIGNGVTRIGDWAFSGCASLSYFSIGMNVKTIGSEAFSDCSGLKQFYTYSIEPPTCGNQALDDINKWECSLVVPAESSDEYKAADQWKDFFFVEEMEVVLAQEIKLNVSTTTLKMGDSLQLIATVLPMNTTRKEVSWVSSNEEVATVMDGKVTAVGLGTATITATCGEVSATCQVTVEPIVASLITLNKEAITLLLGSSATLTATIVPENTTDKTIVWTSSNETVVTVVDGVVTAVGLGTATITATCGEVSATCQVTVEPIVASSITLNKEAITLLLGSSATLTATIAPDNTTDKTIVWTSSNETVATVIDGVVTAVGLGTATITATCGEVSATCQVMVEPILIEGISLNVTETSLKEGETLQLIATIQPDNATQKEVVWSSSDEKIATVTAEGLVTCIKEGEVVITASAKDNSGVSATCTISVLSGLDSQRNPVVEVARYSGEGVLLKEKVSGLNIVIYSNGEIVKEFVE